MSDPSQREPRGRRAGRLGTFGGVFTPSILTILGLVLFLRLGYVVGSGGLAQALLILGVATSISLLTTVSLSAIATNRRVRIYTITAAGARRLEDEMARFERMLKGIQLVLHLEQA